MFEEKLILFWLDFEDINDNKPIPISDLNVSFESNSVNVCPDAISKYCIIFYKNLLNNDWKGECPSSSTCCLSTDLSWGCCPIEKAVS